MKESLCTLNHQKVKVVTDLTTYVIACGCLVSQSFLTLDLYTTDEQ